MTEKDSTTDNGPGKKTPLLLSGVSDEDVTTDFLRGVHEAADSEGLSLESISVETR